MTTFRSNPSRALAACALAALAVAGPVPAAGAGEAEPTPGLRTVSFATEHGQVHVHLTDDLYAGDTLSGTVSLEPKGGTQAQQSQSLGRLQGYVVEVGGERVPRGNERWTRRLPYGATALDVLLVPPSRRAGKPLPERVLVAGPAPAAPGETAPFLLPTVGQAGRPLRVQGPFDGRFETTRLTIGGEEARPLAQSPRQAVFASPVQPLGPGEIRLEERGTTVTGPFRNVGVGLAADRLELQRGERTELRVEVQGLVELERELTVGVANLSPSVVRMDGGDRQSFTVRPAEVSAEGTFVWRQELVGERPGGFVITARVAAPAPAAAPAEPRPGGEVAATTVPPDVRDLLDALDELLEEELPVKAHDEARAVREDQEVLDGAVDGDLGDFLEAIERRLEDLDDRDAALALQSSDTRDKDEKLYDLVNAYLKKRRVALEALRRRARLHVGCCTGDVDFVTQGDGALAPGTTIAVTTPLEGDQRVLEVVHNLPVRLRCTTREDERCLCIADFDVALEPGGPTLTRGPRGTETTAAPTGRLAWVESPLTRECDGKTTEGQVTVTYRATYEGKDFKKIAGPVALRLTRKTAAYECPDDTSEVGHTLRFDVSQHQGVKGSTSNARLEPTP